MLRSIPSRLCALTALALILIGLLTIADSGWRDPYADQWRMYPFYLELPFPASILQLENGHRPILPGLVRVAELHWLGGSQGLQLAIGALAALATVLILAWIALHDTRLSSGRRWLAVSAAAAAVFWLGNGRFLLHGNESVHGYLLTLFAVSAFALLLRSSRRNMDSTVAAPAARTRLILACLLAIAASFCFGPGIATFGALALLLLFERRFGALPVLAGALALTVLAYLMLPDAGGVRGVLHIEPLDNLRIAATGLASMWAHLLQAVHDPEAARALPGWLARLTGPFAQGYQDRFGSLWYQHGPATALGLAAIAYVVVATVTSLRAGEASDLRRCGLALAWFAIGVAGLVALSRLDYFNAHPDQILAQRYLPWSCLFWLGVLLTALATPSRRAIVRAAPVVAITIMLVGVLASTPAYRAWGQRIQDGLALQAAGIAVGALSASQPLWETRLDEVEQVRPMLERQHKAMFAWPEMTLARSSPLPAIVERHHALHVAAESVSNRFGGMALALSAYPTHPAAEPAFRRLLLVDADDRALGLLVRQRPRDGVRYAGYAWPGVTADAIATGRVLAIAGNGLVCLAGCLEPEETEHPG